MDFDDSGLGEGLRYERKKTIHKGGRLSVEQDSSGEVVSVWFNCLALPFEASQCDTARANDMRSMYETNDLPSIRAIEIGPEPPELPKTSAQKLPDQDDWDASIEERSNS